MKKIGPLLCAVFTFITPNVFSQQPIYVGPQRISPPQPASPEAESKLTRFNLDFAGGTPVQLAAEIQKALGRPLNVIVPPDRLDQQLPALKMKGINVAELFRALSVASQRRETRKTSNNAWTTADVSYGFRTAATDGTALSDESIWFFFSEGDAFPKASRFYLLTPYLDAGLTVDDITTAMRTGWKMRGETVIPVLSFHRETKLLIATGELGSLSMIDDVLKALDPVKVKTIAPSAPKVSDERKAEL